MLPKSNKDQVYLWVDAPRWTSVEKMVEIEKDIQNFFLSSSSGSFLDIDKNLDIVSSISSSIWTPFIWDFANLFRWWLERFWENQISTRINLISKDENKNRIKSEDFVLKIRPILRENILKKYPNLTLRLLEDPPWPPVKATFMVSIQWWDDWIKLDDFTKKIYSEVQKVQKKYDLVDLWNSLSTTYRKIAINLNHESISRAWLNVNQVVNSLWIAKTWAPINIIKNSNSFEATNVILTLKSDVWESMQLLDKIFFINSKWDKIPLLSIWEIKYDFVNPEINTDKKEKTNYVYSEVWDNSVVYPILWLMWILKEKSFLNNDYQVIKSWPYWMEFLWKKDWFTYKVNWAWEWELTMDTFADMWIAMLIAILAIYFLIVAEFSSFWVAWIIMLPFLLWFFGIFPWFSILYLLNNEYFNATAMIWVISLAWIVVWNSILLIDYVQIGKKRWWTIENALLKAWYIRFMPIMLTSIAAILWAIKIVSDPVWSWLAWSIVSWLSVSAILTLIAIPIFYYDSQKKIWDKSMDLLNNKN